MANSHDALASLPIFSELSAADLRKVERLMTPITIKAGREFIVEGKPGREAFVILEGRATVRKRSRVLASVGPGDVIGEMAVLANLPRTASITADTDLQVEVLNRRELTALLEEVPRLAMKIMVSAIKHVSELESSLTS